MNRPIFARTASGQWVPDPIARGPFDGMQGGAAAALMCTQIEAMAQTERWGAVASMTTHFLRPVPLEGLTVAVEPLRRGKRVNVIDAYLSNEKGICATSRATLIAANPNDATPVPSRHEFDPASLPLRLRRAPHGGPWMMDAMEVRGTEPGTVWFRLLRPLTEAAAPIAAILPAADWAHGIWPPLGATRPYRAAIPNPDVTIHALRTPVGQWIGVDAATAWSKNGIGAGWAALHDVEGLIGRVAMSVAVAMLEANAI